MAITENEKIAFVEKAVYYAHGFLQKEQIFKPFLMLLNDTKEIEFYDNEESAYEKSYLLLQEMLKERSKKRDIEILCLVVDTTIPENFAKETPQGIRLHLEEKALIQKPIGARFLYVPYQLYREKNDSIRVQLQAPISVGIPAEYLTKKSQP